MPQPQKTIIGRAEKADFSEIHALGVSARIDTGAKTSSIWASDVCLDGSELRVVFFGPDSPFYTGEVHSFDNHDIAVVSSSTGEIQVRYKVRLQIILKGRKLRAWFTLADRSTQVYPVLIGRNVLRGKYVVDVKEGQVLLEEERRRSEELSKHKTQREETA